MQYKVPQNIDQEDKILGPLTFIQFIYVLIGGTIVLIAFSIFDISLFLLIAIPVTLLTVCFALIKIQDQPFSRFFMSLIVYLVQPKKRMWHDLEVEEAKKVSRIPEPKVQPHTNSAKSTIKADIQPVKAAKSSTQEKKLNLGEPLAQVTPHAAAPIAPSLTGNGGNSTTITLPNAAGTPTSSRKLTITVSGGGS